MESQGELREQLKLLFDRQQLGVLSTQTRNRPYASLLAFAATADLKHYVFVTPRSTRKYANVMASHRGAFLIDNRSNRMSDFREAMAVTAVGSVRELGKSGNRRLYRLFADKHPHLQDFMNAPTCAVLCLEAETLHVVNRFQHVVELHLDP